MTMANTFPCFSKARKPAPRKIISSVIGAIMVVYINMVIE